MSIEPINRHRTDLWKADSATSVQMYNEWFLCAAPSAYRTSRALVMDEVQQLFEATRLMRDITPSVILRFPFVISTMRMATAPPIARDRLIGLSNVKPSLVKTLEEGKIPHRMPTAELQSSLGRMTEVFARLLDRTLFDWLERGEEPTEQDVEVARVVVGDRRCGALADPIIRNAQEARQVAAISRYLEEKGYERRAHPGNLGPHEMAAGTYAIHQDVPIVNERGQRVKMPIDIVVQPRAAAPRSMPILIEAKSAGDYTNTNKRRKEEATKARQLKHTYGDDVDFLLLLCGYFDAGYLGYEAAEGLDWIWEHRIEDLDIAGV